MHPASRSPCAPVPVSVRPPACFAEGAGTGVVLPNVADGCRLPFNRPGVSDAAQTTNRPILPPLRLPLPHTCTVEDRPPPSALLLWRSRWPHNFMEFLSRALYAAPALLGVRDAAPLTVVVPGLPKGVPSFYSDVLSPLGTTVKGVVDDAVRGGAFSSITSCCVNTRGAINRSAADAMLALIVRHHLGHPRARPAPLPPLSAEPPWEVALVQRAPLTGGGSPLEERAISTEARLFDECVRRAGSCVRVRFPPEATFAHALGALRRANVLVGMHGAGLANAAFMRAGSAVVEVLGAGFASPGSFAIRPDKFGFLLELGIRRVRLVAPETSGLCARHRSFERLRDCDVSFEWADVERALQRRGRDDVPTIAKAMAAGAEAAPAALVAATPRGGNASSHAPAASPWRCTTWPAGAELGGDEARCLHGNKLADGFVYAHNRARGTPSASCGVQARCTCCRRPARPDVPGHARGHTAITGRGRIHA